MAANCVERPNGRGLFFLHPLPKRGIVSSKAEFKMWGKHQAVFSPVPPTGC